MKAEEIMIPKEDVKTIRPNDKIATAKLKMARNNIGGLPVIDRTNKVNGFITLRDIHIPTVPGNLDVKELMSKKIISKTPKTDIKEIAKIMEKTGIQRIPIVDQGNQLLGLITQTSLIKAINDLI